MKTTFTTVDAYIKDFPPHIQSMLNDVRTTIRNNAPDAVELISYGMPAYKLKGKPLVYFAGYKNHIGFYATPQAHEQFATALSKYKQGKGSVQFPIDKPMPLALIKKMVVFKVKNMLAQ
ncbi:MAG: iron chaperone [Ferruginibacter sp.]